MSIIQWNIRGFRANREQVRTLQSDNNVPIVCLQETKLGNHHPNVGLNYFFYPSPILIGGRAQGGTGIIVHKSINHKVVNIRSVLQACAVQVFTTKWITLCSLYLEPSLESRLLGVAGHQRQLELNDLQCLVDQLPRPFIILGDFNARHTLWGESSCDRWGNLIEELIDQNDIVCMNNGSPTRLDIFHNTSSAIDLTLCSSSLRLDYEWSVDENTHGSDHWPIHLKSVSNIPSPCLPKWKHNEADWDLFDKKTKVDCEVDDFREPFEAYEYLVSILLCGAMASIPRTTSRPRRPVVPWWNQECAISRKITRQCYKRFRRYPCLVNKIIYRRALAKQKKIFKEARRNSFIKYISELKYDTPISQVWNRVRKLLGKFVPSPLPILRINGTLLSDAIEVAEAFATHFASISSALHYPPTFRAIRESTPILPSFSSNSEAFNLPFTIEELNYSLSASSPTSPGEDDILYTMISHLPLSSKMFLLDVLIRFWVSGSSPESWKISIIIAFLKLGKDPYLPQGYRPIALTSCICKIYERMVNVRLVWYLESKKLLSNRQFGFRKGKSTLDPLLIVTREIQNAFAVQNQTIAVFFDLEKAYDTTWRGGILKQMAEWHIGGNMFYCIKDFLSNRFLKVRVGSVFSSAHFQEEGIPQGSVLSPTLFNIAINGLLEQAPVGVIGLAFADDYAIVCSKSTALEACQKIQIAINSASSWANARGFKFSSSKTKAIRFCRLRRREEIPTLFLENNILPYENCIKYLGMFLDSKLTFAHHIDEVVGTVKQRLNILKVVSHFNWGADRTTLLRLYQALCLSRIDYGCQIYGSACKTLLKKLDVVQNLALRICTGAFKTSPVDSLHVDAGIAPLFIRREELGLRYVSRILSAKQNSNYKYVSQPFDRAPNKPTLPKPLEVRLSQEIRDLALFPSSIAEVHPPKYPPWCHPSINTCTIQTSKKSCSEMELKTHFLEHASMHSSSIAFYTDGSKSTSGVGCAVVSGEIVLKRKLPQNTSVFTAELLAVLFAIRYIFNLDSFKKSYVIFTDSQSVLSSLSGMFHSHPLTQEIKDWLVLLHTRRKSKVEFCWVPSHVGISGNERADSAAKDAASLTHTTDVGIPYLDIRQQIHRHVIEKWQHHWSNLNDNLKLKSIKPTVTPWSLIQRDRRSSIVLTRLRIGHTYLTHKFLLTSGGDRQAPVCSTCNVNLSVKHLLVECPSFANERRDFNLVDFSLKGLLDDSAPVERLFNFLKAVGFFYEI